MNEVENKIVELIVEQFVVEKDRVVPAAKFVDDLGADSLDLFEIIMMFEEAFDVEISDEQGERITTVKEAIDFADANGWAI